MTVSSPCIGHCRLEDDVCLGCGRTLGEIAGWGAMPEGERLDVMAGLPERRSAVGPCGDRGEPANAPATPGDRPKAA